MRFLGIIYSKIKKEYYLILDFFPQGERRSLLGKREVSPSNQMGESIPKKMNHGERKKGKVNNPKGEKQRLTKKRS